MQEVNKSIEEQKPLRRTMEEKLQDVNNTPNPLVTHTGHKLTPLEAKFIEEYIVTNNATKSFLSAGSKSKQPRTDASKVLAKPYIKEEIEYRLQVIEDETIADATEIFQYFTSVMRGEIKDQFGLEASLGERTKAAQELARRKIDLADKGTDVNKQQQEVRIVLDWKRDNNE